MLSSSAITRRYVRIGVCAALAVGLGPPWPLFAAPPGLTSTWRTQPIVIDGEPAEWTEPAPLERGPGVSVVNDAQFVYLVVSTTDPAIGDLLTNGLIVWLDAAGGKAQTFGVWVPGPVELPEAPAPVRPLDSMNAVYTEVLDRFDLLGPGKSQRRLVDITPTLGIELASGVREGSLVYELKVPLKKTAGRPYAVGANPGATVGLGIASPEAPRTRRRSRLVGSSGVIGGAGAYGPGFGGTGWAPYREQDERPKPLAVWTTLRLAEEK